MTDNQDLDTEALIFRQIDRVMRTASLDLENFRESSAGQTRILKDVDTWSHRVLMSTFFLDSFLEPIKTEEEQEEIDKAYKNADENYKADGDFLRFFKAKDMFKENVKVLHDKNFVFQESSDMVIEDESEVDGVEPESSEVEEEVIE